MATKVLSSKFYEAMKKLEPRYPKRNALILPALHQAQEEFGWLPKEALEEVAEYIGVHPAQIREVASFYTMYNLKPVGKMHLKVCTNVACMLRGANELVEYAEKKLGVSCGETTADGKFTLSEEECLGACTTAPAMMANDDYVENLTISSLNSFIEANGGTTAAAGPREDTTHHKGRFDGSPQ